MAERTTSLRDFPMNDATSTIPTDPLPPDAPAPTTFGAFRGPFPKGERGEDACAKRARYETWIMQTHAAAIAERAASAESLDPEFDAVMHQPNNTPGKVFGLRTAVRARCFQCVAGDTDEGWIARIRDCKASDCSLHRVRPYQAAEGDGDGDGGDGKRRKLSRRQPINDYCRACMGGVTKFTEVEGCRTANCALWACRPLPTVEDPPVNPL